MVAKAGDTIVCKELKITISKIISQECWDGVWDIEFECANGTYRRWKQYFDGGELIQK